MTEYGQNYVMKSGDAKEFVFSVNGDASMSSIRWGLSRNRKTPPLLIKSTALGGMIVAYDATTDTTEISVFLYDADTEELEGLYIQELEEKADPGSGVVTITHAEGEITIIPDILT